MNPVRRNQKGIAGIITIVIVVVLIGLVVYFISQNTQTKKASNRPRPVTTQASVNNDKSLEPELKQITIQQITESKDTYSLNDIKVEGDHLTLNVSYGGGCKQHFFDLAWNSGFLESAILQVDLHLIHDASGDRCEAMITEDLWFDLKVFGAKESLILNIYDFGRERHRVSYNNE